MGIEKIKSKANARLEKRLERVLIGGAVFGLAGAITGNLLDYEVLEGVSYGVLSADAVLYGVYRFKIKGKKIMDNFYEN